MLDVGGFTVGIAGDIIVFDELDEEPPQAIKISSNKKINTIRITITSLNFDTRLISSLPITNW
jgi:hypothetical protein